MGGVKRQTGSAADSQGRERRQLTNPGRDAAVQTIVAQTPEC